MRTIKFGFLVCAAAALAVAAFGAGRPHTQGSIPVRQVRLGVVDLSSPVPEDLRLPEGKSRWDLTRVVLRPSLARSLFEDDERLTLLDEPVAAADVTPRDSSRSYADGRSAAGRSDRDAARRRLFPESSPEMLRPGARETLDFIEESDGVASRRHAEIETVGIGWVHLPSGPREVVLQRVMMLREEPGGDGLVPDRLIHRWVDPRSGVVAEVSRTPVAAGRAAGAIDEAFVLEQVLAGAATLKIYVEELDTPPFSGIAYGWDRGAGTPISSLTPQAYATIGDLIAADTWDFSANTTGVAENTSTGVTLTAAETCNIGQCGYNAGGLFPNRILSREDKVTLSSGSLSKTNAVTEREQRPGDVTVWLRGGAQNEGVSGGFGAGESRFCYANDDGVTRTPVPIWRFPHQDPLGWFMQPGDASWAGGPFNCEQNIFNTVCGSGGIVPRIWSKGCTGTNGTHAGTQSGQILKGGVVTLPSGHTFNALLVRTLADFCVYAASGCANFFKVDEVRTFVYLWQVPVIGTVVRLNSAQNVADGTSFTTVAETDFKFGLFPPLAITVTGSTDTTVSLSWDPGRDAHRNSGYKVYWGAPSGAGTPYAFDSARNPGQVSFAGTSATVSGLSAGTTYYFTVTSLSAFMDPSTGSTTTYESLLYPTQVSGDPAFVYPMEVQATTTGGTCIPTAEATGVTVEHAGGGIRICWQPASDPCLLGYEVLGAASPTSAANFSALVDTGPETCWTGNPASGYFLVAARGTGGTGPWGAYGR